MSQLRSLDGMVAAGKVECDLDSVAVFQLSTASAEQVTLQIRSVMERAWEYIAIAYQGRAHLALGYSSWDQYVDDRLGDLRLTVPRQQRGAVVQSLSNAQMSLRAIARVLGVSVATVSRAVSTGASEPSPGDDESATFKVKGRDGRQYPKRRKTATSLCTICGETHEEPPDQCPWDLFAQGRGPRPGEVERQAGFPAITPDVKDQSGGEPRERAVAALGSSDSIAESVSRAVSLIDELDVLPELVDEIETATGSRDGIRGKAGLEASIRELTDHLRLQAEAMSRLVQRLEQVARAS